MTHKERFQRLMHFEPIDRVPLWEWGPWPQTVRRWQEEGMEGDHPPEYAECDPRADSGINFGMIPPFQVKVLHRDERTVTYINAIGQKLMEFHERETSMPLFLEYPVKSREDWLQIKKRFDPSSLRYPADWEERLKRWREDQIPLQINGDRLIGFFGPIRELMGAERAMMTFYDDPKLMHEIAEYIAEFAIQVMRKALEEAPVDWVILWEDMAYKKGSLISPRLFKEFMSPNYRKLTDFIRSHGVDVIFVDSDGNVEELIPLWLESGVNGIYPMEVAAGMDVVKLRREYGRDLLMMGGIDKRALAKDREAIDEELKRVGSILDKGGYIPHIDHSIPPDVPYENFRYYWRMKKKLVGIV